MQQGIGKRADPFSEYIIKQYYLIKVTTKTYIIKLRQQPETDCSVKIAAGSLWLNGLKENNDCLSHYLSSYFSQFSCGR